MTPYVNDYDEDCKDDGVIPEHNSKFFLQTMILSDSFNPYTYYESGKV